MSPTSRSASPTTCFTSPACPSAPAVTRVDPPVLRSAWVVARVAFPQRRSTSPDWRSYPATSPFPSSTWPSAPATTPPSPATHRSTRATTGSTSPDLALDSADLSLPSRDRSADLSLPSRDRALHSPRRTLSSPRAIAAFTVSVHPFRPTAGRYCAQQTVTAVVVSGVTEPVETAFPVAPHEPEAPIDAWMVTTWLPPRLVLQLPETSIAWPPLAQLAFTSVWNHCAACRAQGFGGAEQPHVPSAQPRPSIALV